MGKNSVKQEKIKSFVLFENIQPMKDAESKKKDRQNTLNYTCYNQTGDISTQDGTSRKLVDKFTYLGSSVSSTEKDIDTRLTKA